MKRFAHSVEGQSEAAWEPLSHHLAAVGQCAASFAALFGASPIALAMGLLHDIGKQSEAYQNYIRRPRDASGKKGPDHSTAGAKEAVAAYGKHLGTLMAFGIAGHHGGLMDGSGHEGSTLPTRLTKAIEDYKGWTDHVTGLPAMDAMKPPVGLKLNAVEPTFTPAFLARMLFSCLVDADFLETEAFYAQSRKDPCPVRGGALTPQHRDTVHAYMARHRRDDTPVNQLRSDILNHANGKAALPPGLFTLTVPTGGGKTLTSLSFAMEHAVAHDLRRIIYVIPFTEAWIETSLDGHMWRAEGGRLPHGGVDRNARGGHLGAPFTVASHTEAWIETGCSKPKHYPLNVASHTEAWIETSSMPAMMEAGCRPPARQ